MRSLFTLVVLGLFAAPGTARADMRSWTGFCSSGSLRTCASVQLETVNTADGTRVTIRFRNLQGTHPFDNTGGSIVNKIGIVGVGIDDDDLVEDLEVTTEGSVGREDEPEDEWEVDDSDGFIEDIIGDRDLGFVLQADGDGDGGILGCSDADDDPSDFFRTCNSLGYGGWVVFTFTTEETWSASDVEIAWQVVEVSATDGGRLACWTGGQPSSGPVTSSSGPFKHSDKDDDDEEPEDVPACVEMPYDTNVVPEPITMVLLGTGLAGIGGTALRRRRRDDELVED